MEIHKRTRIKSALSIQISVVVSIDSIFYNTGVFTNETFVGYPIYDFQIDNVL